MSKPWACPRDHYIRKSSPDMMGMGPAVTHTNHRKFKCKVPSTRRYQQRDVESSKDDPSDWIAINSPTALLNTITCRPTWPCNNFRPCMPSHKSLNLSMCGDGRWQHCGAKAQTKVQSFQLSYCSPSSLPWDYGSSASGDLFTLHPSSCTWKSNILPIFGTMQMGGGALDDRCYVKPMQSK